MMRKEGKEEDRQQGALASSIGNIRGLLFSEGRLREREGKEEGCEGEKKGKKRTL